MVFVQLHIGTHYYRHSKRKKKVVNGEKGKVGGRSPILGVQNMQFSSCWRFHNCTSVASFSQKYDDKEEGRKIRFLDRDHHTLSSDVVKGRGGGNATPAKRGSTHKKAL